MRMTGLEKLLVNRKAKGLDNADRVLRQMRDVGCIGGHDLLEIGCGIGVASAVLAWEGWRVTATDIDPSQIEKATARHPGNDRLCFVVSDATSLDFDDDSFDVVVMQNVLHHIPHWPTVVNEIARVLRVGGHVFLLDLAIPPALRRLASVARNTAGVYTTRELADAFEEAGMRQRHFRALFPLAVRFEAVFQRAAA